MAFSWSPDGSIVVAVSTASDPDNQGEGEQEVSTMLYDVRNTLQPPSVARLVLAAHDTFEQLHAPESKR